MTISQTLDVRAYINDRKMTGYQWLLLGLCFLIVATDGMDRPFRDQLSRRTGY